MVASSRFLGLIVVIASAILPYNREALAVKAAKADYGEQVLTIVTSFPPSFFEPFKAAFEQANPGVALTMMQRNTASAVRMILEKRNADADLFWASAPDAFEVLKAKGELRPISPRPTGSPGQVSGYPVNDPNGHYLGFALSGYGLVYNPSYLREHRLPVPRTWSDLTLPVYSGHVGISSPSRSGTTHLIIEAILQTHGWKSGWALLSRMGGNLSTVTARSFGVPSGVARRRFGVGITIDFLARLPGDLAEATRFILPKDTVFVPASIGILARSRNVALGERFVDFVLSKDGQSLLLHPAIDRIPVMPALQPATFGNPLAGQEGLMNGQIFDAALSARRYHMVNLVFEQFIVRRRGVLARLWAEVARAGQAGLDEASRNRLALAVRALETPPIDETLAVDRSNRWQLDDVPAGLPVPPAQAALVASLRSAIEQRLQDAGEALAGLEPEGEPFENLH